MRHQRGLGRGLATLCTSLTVLTACGTTVPITGKGASQPGTPAAGLNGGTNSSALPSIDEPDSTRDYPPSKGMGTETTETGSQSGDATDRKARGRRDEDASATSASTARVVTPMRLGILTVDLGDAIAALGGSSGSSGRADDGYRALIKATNASGGMSGRRLDPTYYRINATDSSYQQEASTACSTFGDAKVEVVLTEAASTDYGLASCLAKLGIPLISASASDTKGFTTHPWLFNAFNPSYNRGYGAVVDQLVANGYVTTKSRLGVIRIDCPEVTRAYQDTVLPRMRAAKLTAPIEYTVSCASGFQDAGAYSAAMQNAVLRFRSQDVDRVFILGAQESLLLQYFATQAQNQAYHPGYALSSFSLPYTLIGASTFPQEQLPEVRGVGWHPQADTGLDPKQPAERRCVDLAGRGGFKAANIPATYGIYINCSNFFLLDAAVRTGNGSATGNALRATIPALRSTFGSTGLLDQRTFFGPGRQDGPQSAGAWAYTTHCSCFRYTNRAAVMR